MQDSAIIMRIVEQLMQSGSPISFYDALLLVRRARRVPDLSDGVVAGLVRMHDAARTTDGGRDLLAEFLRACVQKRTTEETLAARAILLSDNGKLARAKAGHVLALELSERRGAGYRWRVTEIIGQARCERTGTSPSDPPLAQFEVSLRQAGHVLVRLEEQPPPAGSEDPEETTTQFTIRVAVERS